VAVVALLAAACTTSGEDGADTGSRPAGGADTLLDAGPPQPGGTLVVGVTNETNGWNPHDNQWAQAGSLVGSSVIEPLLAIDHDLNPVPWLARSWMPDATFESYTLELRDGVRFHDGTPFDAAAVKANMDDAKAAPLTGTVWGKVLGETTVVDRLTVRIGLTEPFASFPTAFLTAQTGFMLAPSMFTADRRGSDHPVGTGPFVFESWTSGSRFTATRNADYWQAGKPYLDRLEFAVLGDGASQVAALQADDVQLVFTSAYTAVEQVPDSFTVLQDWTSQPGMVITNTLAEADGQPNPMANHHARLAVARATDRQALADSVGPGVQSITSPFPPESKWGMPTEANGYPDFDLAKAREEVAAYQAETGSSLAVTLSLPAGPDVAKLGEQLQSQWKEAGIETTLESIEATALITDVIGAKYQLVLFPVYGSPDPDQNHHFWSAETAKGPGSISINFSQYTSPSIEDNLRIGRQSPDFATRKAAYDAVVHELNAEAVNIWTFSTPYSVIAAPSVHGLEGVADVPLGNYQPRTWLADLWLSAT
jgi:peptide/nickel transport system substrate-binding protein